MLTPANFGQTSDVYATLPTGSGLVLGMVRQEPNAWRFRQLVQNNPIGSTIVNGAALTWTATEGGEYVVDATTATTDTPCVGVNDAAGASISAGQYFWMTIKGFASALVANGTAQGVVVNPIATAGVLGVTTAVNQQGNIITAAAQTGGGNTITLCQIL